MNVLAPVRTSFDLGRMSQLPLAGFVLGPFAARLWAARKIMNVSDQAVTFITKAWPAPRIVASGADFQTMSQLK